MTQATNSQVNPDPALITNDIYKVIAQRLIARNNRMAIDPNDSWVVMHEERINWLVRDFAPHGSGFDSGTQFLFDESTPQRLVFQTSFHHMSQHGSYDGWTEHRIVVTPSLAFGFDMKVSGPNRNDIKSFIHELMDSFLTRKERY